MLAALLVLLRTLGLLCSGHGAVARENVALRQQLRVLRRNVRRPHLRTGDRLFWVLAMGGVMRAILEAGAPPRRVRLLRRQLVLLCRGFLMRVAAQA